MSTATTTETRRTAQAAAFTWSRRHVLALVVLCLAALLDTVDVTVVNVGMPAIRTSLHFSEGALPWMVNAYMVPFGGFMLLAGRPATCSAAAGCCSAGRRCSRSPRWPRRSPRTPR